MRVWQFADLRGTWQQWGGGVLKGGWYPSAHYAWWKKTGLVM